MLDNQPSPTQEDAVRAALLGGPIDRLRVGANAMIRLLSDPNDTEQVLVAGVIANHGRFPEFLARWVATTEGMELLDERPSIDSKSVDFDWLRSLPDGTLGCEYSRYLDANDLDPDIFQAPPGLPELPTYIAKRMRQSHDLWHVLTGYGSDVPGEIALQAFTYAQTRMPSAGLIALLGSVRFTLGHAEVWPMIVKAYRRGRRADFIASVRWENHWEESIDSIRQRYSIEPHAASAVG